MKTYFHIDLDAFFASVEQLDNPGWKGRPVIVGGLPGDRRAVVSTASYEARKYGVHSAMPLSRAVQLCPNAIFVRGRYRRYQELSARIMAIFGNYSPDMTQMSIDEAFLDMTGTERLFGMPEDAARRIKDDVKKQTGLSVSIGVAGTMYVAKIASGLNKPDGLTVVKAGDETAFMLALPLEKLWGAGGKTQKRLRDSGLFSTADIYGKSETLLQTMFGDSAGSFLYQAVRGNPGMTFGEEARNHSISSECTYDFDLTDRYAIDTALMELSMNVLYRMHKEQVKSRTLALKIRYEDFTTVSVQETGDFSISNADDMFERCRRLFDKKYERGRGIRLLGVACEKVYGRDVPDQKSLFDFGDEKKARIEEAIYKMQDKHPEIKIRKARMLGS
ncbi:MAG: DNA polymerase IV [Treponema sp.]|nr:DNA polymerase IV [Treponema sp.]MBQ7166349.1 DNA polymerase IV [Treponema sp.]